MKKERAVAPVISSLLMMTVVVMGFGILMFSTEGFINNERFGRGLAIRERYIIEDVWFRVDPLGGNPNFLTISIRNVGTIIITIVRVDVGEAGQIPQNVQFTPKPLNIIPGERGSLNATGFIWAAGTTYSAKIFTDRGSTYESQFTA